MRTFAPKPKGPQQANLAKSATIGRELFGQTRGVNSIFHLQRTFGNQAVQRLLAKEFARSATTVSASLGYDLSRIRLHPPATKSILTKLAINRPGDSYEQEADRAADKVMNLSSPEFTPVRVSGPSDINPQRKSASCKEEETLHRKENSVGPVAVPPIVHEVLGCSGQPLDPATRAFMEPRFGHDFGNVRVHADQRAAASASAIDALAYSSGESIVFGPGRHRPDTTSGRHLLAHELAHIVQQAQQPARVIYRKATKQDEADKVIAVKDHTLQQQRVVQFLSNALKIKPDPAKGPLDPDNLYHNTAELVEPPQTAKAVLKVLTPTHYSGPNNLMFFDNRVKHPQIQGDYPADPRAWDSGLVQPPGSLVLGQTEVLKSSSSGSASTMTPKEEKAPSRVDPTYTGKEEGMPKSEATEPAKTKTPAKPSTPPVIVWYPAEIKLFLGRPAVSEAEFKSTFVHEGQHAADWVYLKQRRSENWKEMLELYKSEFRAFWIQPPGGFTFGDPKPIEKSATTALLGIAGGQGCDVCGGSKGTASAPQPVQMKNQRQEKIFFYLLDAYRQNHFDCFYVCNKDFRDAVNAYDQPIGINLANSRRLIDLSIELQKLTPDMTREQIGKTQLQSAIEKLDAIDWVFLKDALKDYLAEKDRTQSDSFWKSVDGFAPAPLAEAFKALAKKGNPSANDVSEGLKKALAKLKAR